MKFCTLLFFFVFLSIRVAFAQPVGDCAGGILMCSDFYTEQNAPTGFGNVQEFVGDCNFGVFGESNSIWYIFTIDSDGFMNFILTPNNLNDDYDWAVLNITNAGCAGINALTSPVVSCNSFGLIGFNGPTGISTANGGVGNSNGPGNLNGPAFNANLQVQTGQTYALCVMNWTGSPNGYTLDFSGSTASFYDNVPPSITSVTYDCSDATLLVSFSENVQLSSVQPSDFVVSGPQGNLSMNSVTPLPGSQTQFSMQLSGSIDIGGDYQLNITNVESFITDECGNQATEPFDFILPDAVSFDATPTIACLGLNGSIEVSNISGGAAPYLLSLDGTGQPDFAITGLNAGNYQVSVTDDNGCVSIQTIEVLAHNVNIQIPAQDELTCNLTEVIFAGVNVTPVQNVSYSWSTADGSILSGANAIDPTVDAPGTYTVNVVNEDNGCSASQSVVVTYDDSGEITIEFGPNVSLCEGETLLLNPNNGNATYLWQDGSSNPTFTVTTGGVYSVTVTNGSCEGFDQITVSYTPDQFSTIDISICQGEMHTLPDGNQVAQVGTYIATISSPVTGCPQTITTNLTVLPLFTTQLQAAICQGESHLLPNNESVSATGTYPVVFSSSNGCDSIVTTFLTVHPNPTVTFSWNPERPYLQDPNVQFTSETQFASSFAWDFGSQGTASIANPEFAFPNDAPGFYTVCLEALSDFGCSTTDCRTVGVYSQMNFWCPNAFTPDSDDINDVFKPVLNGHDPKDYLFEIFDRWGEKVFTTENPEMGWTGNHTSGAHYVQNDLYYWHAKVQPLGVDNRQLFSGIVVILR